MAGTAEKYDHKTREPYWQAWWKKEGIFRFDPNHPGSLYSIDTPPPTISGNLHLGHAFSYSQAEAVASYFRMKGYNVRYPFGLDNNGLPTEKLTEKEEGLDASQTELASFQQACFRVIEKFAEQYRRFFERLGFRWDLNLEYSTISPEVQRLSQSVFLKLLNEGKIYRKKSPILFCPVCRTSVAQAEVDHKELQGVFYDLVFKTQEGQNVLIATTRPELLPACVAVFVNPSDARYKGLISKQLETPLGKRVQVFADERVLPEKGTGVVMCCTYGDVTDVYWVKVYGLQENIILSERGVFAESADVPLEMRGKSVEEGRKILVDLLKKSGALVSEKPIAHEVGVHERCGTPVEIIPTEQWFVGILDFKDQLIEAADKINWYPSHMKKRYLDWIQGLSWDWCISRGRFFGIPIPVFYCRNCKGLVLPQENELPIDPRLDKTPRSCEKCKVEFGCDFGVDPEASVLDTWFTSALTPQINDQHPLNGRYLSKIYPMSMRPHAHDIIRTWSTYTILMGLFLHNEVPWRDLMISGHVLAKKGEKISKKSGGGKLSPLELAEEYSADALRFVFFGAGLGKDVYFDEEDLQRGRKLVVKIFNAGRFVLQNLRDFDPQVRPSSQLEALDQWILFKTAETAARMAEQLEAYEYGKARQIFEEFFWRDFCDNYLELVKGRVYSQAQSRHSAQYALYHAYLSILKMIAPFLPHVSEEMYHCEVDESCEGRLLSSHDKGYFFKFEQRPSIHLTPWPSEVPEISLAKNMLELGGVLTLRVVREFRVAKTQVVKGERSPFTEMLVLCSDEEKKILEPFTQDIKNFSKVESLRLVNNDTTQVCQNNNQLVVLLLSKEEEPAKQL